MHKKYFFISLAVAVALSVALVVLAQTPRPAEDTPPFKIEVNYNGKVLVRGAKVTNVATSTVTAVTSLSSLQITWTINVNGNTEILRRGGGRGPLSEIAKDHIVSFEGTLVSGPSQPTVDARMLRDWSVQKLTINQFGVIESINSSAKSFVVKTTERGTFTVLTNEATKIFKQGATTTFSVLKVGDKVTSAGLWDSVARTLQAERIRIHVEERKVFEGGRLKSIVSSTTPTTLIVTFGRFDYTVHVSGDTAVLDRNWTRALLSDFRERDRLRVYGAADGITIEATVVRNTDLPR